MKDIADLLRHHPFAEGLDEDTLALIAGCAKNVVLQPGDYLHREGAAADSFYLAATWRRGARDFRAGARSVHLSRPSRAAKSSAPTGSFRPTARPSTRAPSN